MALMPAIRGFASFTGDVADAFAAPGEERRRRRRAQETANLETQQARTAQQQLRTQRQQGQLNLEQRSAALPVSTQEAQATQDLAEQDKASDHARATDMVNTQVRGVGETLDRATDGRVRIIDANIQGDLAKYTGWNNTIGARQDSILNRAWDHEKGMARMFVGDTPALDGMRQELQNDRDMVVQMEQNRRNNPLEWVNAANQTALTLGTLFL